MIASAVGRFVGAFVGVFLFSRLLRWLLRRTMGDTAGLIVASLLATLILATVLGGYGHSRGGSPQFLYAFEGYAPAVVVWLMLDLFALRGRRVKARERGAGERLPQPARDPSIRVVDPRAQ